ncbi:MAG: hypothetical protein IJB79_04850 [Candidatus Gastranaerophilales bacterium]|nr:hypothetical protein [Candidatus Gastranaerophilales bacterium]
MDNELMDMQAFELKPVDLQGNGIQGNGMSCPIIETDFDLFLNDLSL